MTNMIHTILQLRMNRNDAIAGPGDLDRQALIIPVGQHIVAEYCERMRLDEIPYWNFYVDFSLFRYATILQGVRKRAPDGIASSNNSMSLGKMVKILAFTAVNLCFSK